MENLEKGLDNWEKVGVLDGLSPEDKLAIAKLFQEASIYLITSDIESKHEGVLEILTLPALRRIYLAGKKDIDVTNLCDELAKYIDNTIDELKGYQDPQKEVLKMFVEYYLEKK